MVIAVDFDGTLSIDGRPNFALIGDLRAAQANGASVFLFSSRTGHRLSEAVSFCCKHGLLLNGAVGGKPLADLYIDDKAMRPVFGGANGD